MDITIKELAQEANPAVWIVLAIVVVYGIGLFLARGYVQKYIGAYYSNPNSPWGSLNGDALCLFIFSPISVPLMLAWKFMSFKK